MRKRKKIKKLLKKRAEKCLEIVDNLLDTCEDQAEDLVVADTSRHGCLTVHSYKPCAVIYSNSEESG